MTTQPTAVPAKRPPAPREVLAGLMAGKRREALQKLCGSDFSLDRFERLVFAQTLAVPELLECDMGSWWIALQKSVSLRLYPDAQLGHAYLIPRMGTIKERVLNRPGGEMITRERKAKLAVFQVGYKGMVDLARRTGEVLAIWAEVVYARDTFREIKGIERNIIHEPYEGGPDPGPLTHAYAVAKLVGGETVFRVLRQWDIDRAKLTAQTTSPLWTKHEPAAWRKTALNRLCADLPMSTVRPGASEKLEALSALAGEEDAPLVLDAGHETRALDAPADRLDDLAEELGGRIINDEPDPEPIAETRTGKEAAGIPERTVGEDDGDPAPSTAATLVGAMQAVAEKPAEKKTRQGRLTE